MKRVLTSLVLCVPLMASGQASDRATELVEELKSPSFVTRELAEDDLQYDQSLTLEDLEAHLRRNDLTKEQRIRLLKAASVRFANEPRAAMGIGLTNVVNDLGLQIREPVQGFDSANKLQASDFISVIGDLPIRSTTDLQAAIISRSPGDSVPVQIVRGEQRLTVDIVLGAWSDLEQPGGGVPRGSLEAAWIYRSREYAGKDEPGVIGFDVDPNLWNAAATRPMPGQGSRRETGNPIRPLVVVGGEARPRPGSMAGVRLDRPLASSARGRASDFPPLLKQELIKTEIDIAVTQERIRKLKVSLDISRQNGARPMQTQQIEAQLEEFETILDELSRRADRIRKELAGMGIQDP